MWSRQSPDLRDGCGVAQHAHSPLDFGQVSTRYHSGKLVINANLEVSGVPVHKMDDALGLDGGNSDTTSLGTMSPQYNRQQAMYLPSQGSLFTIWLDGSK